LLRVYRVSAAFGTTIETAAFDATDTSTASEAAETTIDGKHWHNTRLESIESVQRLDDGVALRSLQVIFSKCLGIDGSCPGSPHDQHLRAGHKSAEPVAES
ncbi:serine-type d-ala-d-ala carboxypeptidase, partial [Lasius niger]